MDQQIMWQVPPIQFTMDKTAIRVNEVEELLRVADFGPDFEPTSLADCLRPAPSQAAMDNNMTNSSCQSGIETVTVIPGPGVSTELVTTATSNNNMPSFTQHFETSNVCSEDVLPLHIVQESTGGKTDDAAVSFSADDGTLTLNAVIEREYHSQCRNFEADCSDAAKPTLEFRSDIFGVDHARLWQQVFHAKRKAANRSYRCPPELAAHFSAASESAKNSITCDAIARSRMRKRFKKERLRRNQLLVSCHYHNSVNTVKD